MNQKKRAARARKKAKLESLKREVNAHRRGKKKEPINWWPKNGERVSDKARKQKK